MIDQQKINAAFDAWMKLTETEQIALDAQIRGYVLCRAANGAQAPARRGRPKGSKSRNTFGIGLQQSAADQGTSGEK